MKQLGAISTALVLALACVAGGAAATWFFLSDKVAKAEKRADAADSALKSSIELRSAVDKNLDQANEKVAVLQGKQSETERKLRDALRKSPDCRLGTDAGRLLRDAVPGRDSAAADKPAPGATGPAGGGGAGADVAGAGPGERSDGSVSAQAVAIWAQRNIAIAQRNAERHWAVIRQYEIVRRQGEK